MIERLIFGLSDDLSAQTLLDVTGLEKTFVIANVIEKVQRPTYLEPNKPLAAQFYSEMRDFPKNAVETSFLTTVLPTRNLCA